MKKKHEWTRKGVTASMAVVLAFGMVPSAALAQDGIEGHWNQAGLEEWMGYGVLKGYGDGRIAPDDPVSRAQMVAFLDRTMGYQETADNVYSDVVDGAWYEDVILRGVAAGVIMGDGGADEMRPEALMTRQEAAAVVARAVGLDCSGAPDAGFKDQADIDPWFRDVVNAMAERGYVNGYDGYFRPDDLVTRAEAIAMLNNVFADLCQESGEYSSDVDGSLVVSADGASLEDMAVSGDLIVAEGVGDGHVELDNVTVGGRLIVRGGGADSVIVKGASKIGEIVVDRQGDPVRVAVEGDAEVGTVTVAEDTVSLKLEGKVASVSVETPGVELSVTGEVEALTVAEEAEGAKVSVEEGAVVSSVVTSAPKAELSVAGKVETVSVKGDSTVVEAVSGGEVAKVEADAAGTVVKGEGKVESVVAGESSSDVVVSTEGTGVVNNGSGSVTDGEGGTVAKPGAEATTPGGSTSGGGSTGGGTGGPNVVVLSGTAASQSGDGTGFETIGEDFVLDPDNEIPAGVSAGEPFTQEQVAALGGSGDYRSLTLYAKVEGTVGDFDSIEQLYVTDDGSLATMKSKSNAKTWTAGANEDGDFTLNGETGRYAVKDGVTYVKLALYSFHRDNESSPWELISDDASKQVLQFKKGDVVVATVTFDSPLKGHAVAPAAGTVEDSEEASEA